MTATPTQQHRPRVVIVGGGFGGLWAMKALRRAEVDVVLVDRHPYNTFQPLLYQVATSGLNPGDVTYFLRAIRSGQKNVRFRHGTVHRIDTTAQQVHTDSGDVIGYDYLVIANGVTTNYFGVPGAKEHALALYTRTQAIAVRDRVLAVLEQYAVDQSDWPLEIVVVGGGATGVEMAGALAELRNSTLRSNYPEIDPAQVRITLIEMGPEVLAPFDAKLRTYAAKALRKRGVELRLSTSVREVRSDCVTLGEGGELPAALVIWATGVTTHSVVQDWGVPQGHGGRIVVDHHLRVHGLPNVFAVGDVALTPDPLAQLAQPAMQGGRHAGRQILRLISDEPTQTFSYSDKGTMATIGRSSAVAQITHVPDLYGFVAWVIWLGLHIVMLLGNRNRISTLANLAVRYLWFPRSSNVIVGEMPAQRPRT